MCLFYELYLWPNYWSFIVLYNVNVLFFEGDLILRFYSLHSLILQSLEKDDSWLGGFVTVVSGSNQMIWYSGLHLIFSMTFSKVVHFSIRHWFLNFGIFWLINSQSAMFLPLNLIPTYADLFSLWFTCFFSYWISLIYVCRILKFNFKFRLSSFCFLLSSIQWIIFINITSPISKWNDYHRKNYSMCTFAPYVYLVIFVLSCKKRKSWSKFHTCLH